ncbi:hypothetical protein JYU34_012434, partial [Plutella xylostella]
MIRLSPRDVTQCPGRLISASAHCPLPVSLIKRSPLKLKPQPKNRQLMADRNTTTDICDPPIECALVKQKL